jgi:hypothetical protein
MGLRPTLQHEDDLAGGKGLGARGKKAPTSGPGTLASDLIFKAYPLAAVAERLIRSLEGCSGGSSPLGIVR